VPLLSAGLSLEGGCGTLLDAGGLAGVEGAGGVDGAGLAEDVTWATELLEGAALETPGATVTVT
jgi:hypothetical protein